MRRGPGLFLRRVVGVACALGPPTGIVRRLRQDAADDPFDVAKGQANFGFMPTPQIAQRIILAHLVISAMGGGPSSRWRRTYLNLP